MRKSRGTSAARGHIPLGGVEAGPPVHQASPAEGLFPPRSPARRKPSPPGPRRNRSTPGSRPTSGRRYGRAGGEESRPTVEDLLGRGRIGPDPPGQALSGGIRRNLHASDTHRFSGTAGGSLSPGTVIEVSADTPGRSGLRPVTKGAAAEAPPPSARGGRQGSVPNAQAASLGEGYRCFRSPAPGGEGSAQAEAVVAEAFRSSFQQRGFPPQAGPTGPWRREDPHRRRVTPAAFLVTAMAGDRANSRGGSPPTGRRPRPPRPEGPPCPNPPRSRAGRGAPAPFPGLQHATYPRLAFRPEEPPGSRDEPLHLLPDGRPFLPGRSSPRGGLQRIARRCGQALWQAARGVPGRRFFTPHP